ncbi:UV damage repair protein UvrX [Chryseomicrobium palamuruense]|uniref:UV damage repair protein UvrX n=1 Tax=Chryseomicrobium palamuruense TaxID=682973 RepID=A0ABV8V0P5_9BACL
MYELLEPRKILCIDMQSFFASCSAAVHGLDIQQEAIAIVGNLEQKGSVVLAASSPMKKRFGVKTGTRLFEIPNHPDIRIIQPQMELYVKISAEITRYLNQIVPMEDIHVYSIDESFIDIKGTEHLWGDAWDVARKIRSDLLRQFQVPCTIGIGPNMLLAKLALDLEAKKTTFAEWTYEDVPTKLWPVSPLRDVWGIGPRLERTLHSMGIYTMGDLAHTPLERLEDKFGVMGNQLYHHAWGIDLSDIGAPLMEGQVSYGKGQILFRDYNSKKEVMAVVLEMTEDVGRRLREAKKVGRTMHMSIGYSKFGGFSRSMSIDEATNRTSVIYEAFDLLMDTFYDGSPVRRIALSVSNLEEDESLQLNLFSHREQLREERLGKTVDALRRKYGSTAVLRAVSYTADGTARYRATLLGGHNKL